MPLGGFAPVESIWPDLRVAIAAQSLLRPSSIQSGKLYSSRGQFHLDPSQQQVAGDGHSSQTLRILQRQNGPITQPTDSNLINSIIHDHDVNLLILQDMQSCRIRLERSSFPSRKNSRSAHGILDSQRASAPPFRAGTLFSAGVHRHRV
jgi:hypothetical protein